MMKHTLLVNITLFNIILVVVRLASFVSIGPGYSSWSLRVTNHFLSVDIGLAQDTFLLREILALAQKR